MNNSKIIIATVLSLSITAFCPAMLQPYVLQGPHILQLMTEKLGQAKRLSVSQRVIFYDIETPPDVLDENTGGGVDEDTLDFTEHQPGQLPDEVLLAPPAPKPVQLEESLKYVFSRAFRSDIVSDITRRIHVFNAGRALTVIDGTIADTEASRFDLYKDLLLYRSRATLSQRLADLGVDVSVSSLGKFDNRLALVVGAEFPDTSVPQIWVDKETFHPLRMIIPPAPKPYGTSSGALEFRYADWQQIGKIWYPMQIEFIQDGMTVRAVEVSNYQIDPSFPKGIFDIARLMSAYPRGVQPSERPVKSEGLSEVQKTIEQFKKLFE